MWSLFLGDPRHPRTCQRYTRTRAHVLGVARVRVSNQYTKKQKPYFEPYIALLIVRTIYIKRKNPQKTYI